MSLDSRSDSDRRLLVLTPIGRDAAMTRAMLAQAGIDSQLCANFREFDTACASGAGAVLLAEEATSSAQQVTFAAFIRRQPSWSDLPVLLLTGRGADSPLTRRAVEHWGNVTLLERPIRVAALQSAVRSALRARERQYQVRDQLLELHRATEATRQSERNLREADRRKDEFLATLAHELRNPLAPIRNALHILELAYDGEAATGRARELIARQVKHMVRLVDDLLEISRITRGKIELHREAIDLATVLRAGIETSRPLIDAGGHALTLELPDEPLLLYADAMRLAQVFSNLLNNAAKYMDRGGSIRVQVHRDSDNAVVSVIDHGIGVAADMLPRVFDMFAQAGDSRSRAQGGLGIGLTLARNLVEMHGGCIEARSAGLGRGSEFIIYLPLETVADDGVADAPAAASAAASYRRRFLVVDDNRDAADSFGALLQLLGADVAVVYGGHEALERVDSYRPEIVILDLGMPGMDGYQLAQHLREHPACAQATLIALTGWGQEQDRQRTAAAGFAHHLVKPVDLDRLEALLETI